MAGKKKAPSPAQTTVSPEVAAKVAELKGAADRAFLSKRYDQACDAYESAIKLLGDAPEKAEFQQRVAGCYLIEKRYKEAVKACSATLETQPGSAAALKTRAKAYEQLGFFKQALADVVSVNKADGGSDETRSLEARLKDTMNANRKTNGGSEGSEGMASAAKEAPSKHRNSMPYTINILATLEGETRSMQASLMVSYADLLDAIQEKFPGCGPVVLKYNDKDGDAITITSRSDIQNYLAEIVTQYQRAQAGGVKNAGAQLPPMKLACVKVGSHAEVPVPPADERPQTSGKATQDEAPVYEQDDWLLEFSRLFTEITGLDPTAHHEALNIGTDQLQRAIDVTLSDEEALPLFDKASEAFKEATCDSMVQWGNVHIIKADRQAQAILRTGKPLDNKAIDAMMKEFDEGEKKFQEALKIKPNSATAAGSLGQLDWERAKARMGYIVPTNCDVKADEEAYKEANTTAARETLGKLEPKRVDQAKKYIDNGVSKWFAKALASAKEIHESNKAEQAAAAQAEGKELPAKTAEEEASTLLTSHVGNILVMHGNVLYEWSQVQAAISRDWRPILDSAVEKFREAGAGEAEIRAALKNHSQSEHLDLGPDPEPEAPPAPAEAHKAPEAKGLPSLEVKKKAAAKA